MQKILIVDDNADLRKLVRVTLSKINATLFEAETGQQALEIVSKEAPELVILDVMMPGKLNGYDVCAAIKSDPLTSETKVILLTARGQGDDLKRGREVSADVYLVKPFSPLALYETVRSEIEL